MVIGGPPVAYTAAAPPTSVALHLDYDVPNTGDPESFTTLGGLATAPDGRVFALDVVEHRVLRFGAGSDHAFEAAWGGLGQAEGLFDLRSRYQSQRAGLGIAVGGDGSVWVADTGNHRIQRFRSDGTFVAAFGRRGSELGQFIDPIGMAIAPDGTLYVGEYGNRRIQRLTADGQPLSAWSVGGVGGSAVGLPLGLAVSVDGTVTVADGNPDAPGLRRYSATGRLLGRWALAATPFQRSTPRDLVPLGVAAAPDGSIYATTSESETPFVRFSSAGTPLAWFGVSSQGQVSAAIGGIAVHADGMVFAASFASIAIVDPNDDPLGSIDARPLAYGRIARDTALAVDGAGNVYAVDPESRRVQVFDAGGNLQSEWRGGRSPVDPEQFVEPRDVAVAPDGTLFVVDRGANAVRWRSRDGLRAGSWGEAGAEPGQLDAPMGIAAAPDGHVYVADTRNHRVQVFAPDGTLVTVIGAAQEGGVDRTALGVLDAPVDVAVAPDGSVRVLEAGNHRVQVFGRDGAPRHALGSLGAMDGQLSAPAAIAVDAEGGTWVADRANGRLVRWDACGRLLPAMGGALAWQRYRVGALDGPTGVAIGPDGSAYAADSGNARIQRFGRDGRVTAVWGVTDVGPGVPEWADHSFRAEGLRSGYEVLAAGPDGTLLAIDLYTAQRIQRFDALGRRLGQIVLEARDDDGATPNARSLAVATDGTLAVVGGPPPADGEPQWLLRYDAEGRFLNRWPLESTSHNLGVAAAPEGVLLIADFTTGSIVRYRPDGTRVDERDGGLAGAREWAVGPTGTVYSAQGSTIRRYASDGSVDVEWGGTGTAPGLFGDPFLAMWLSVWPDGLLVAADLGNQRVQVFDADGEFVGRWGIPHNPDIDIPPWSFPGPLAALADGSLMVVGSAGSLQRFTRGDDGWWHVSYYPNRWLAQRPLAAASVARPTFGWGDGAPDEALPIDGFSALVQRVIALPTGRNRFRIAAQGGVRAWVDHRLVVDAWDGPVVDARFDVISPADGTPHAIRVLYNDPGGYAALRIEGPTR